MTSAPTKPAFVQGVTEVGCAAHARRKFFELHANRRQAPTDRQQLGREPDPLERDRAFELAVRWVAARRPTRCSGDELTQSAKLNQLDPHAYLKDVLQRPPKHKVRLGGELLPHQRQPHHQSTTEVRG